MTDPHDSPPDHQDTGPDALGGEPDPTGVRAILSALPDPGPMPADLVQRITASLAQEQSRPGQGSRSVGAGAVHSLAAARERRTSLGRRLPTIAVAASIVVLAGAVVLGLFAMNNGLGMTASYDAAAEHSVSDGDAGQGGEAGSAEPFGSRELAPPSDGTDGTDESGSMVAAGPPVLATGALLTNANLVEHARSLRDGPAALGHDAAAARSMTTSPVGTPEGAADCLGAVLDITSDEATGLIAAVDFVHFDGSPAALILVSDADIAARPADETEAGTAYVVPLDCGPGADEPLHDPVRIDS